MEGGSTLVTAALLGAAAVIGAVIKPLIDLVRGRRNGFDEKARHKLADLWTWHAPDSKGQQSWRGTEIKDAIELNREATGAEFKRLHHANEKIEEAIEENTNTLRSGFAEVVSAIRDLK